MKTPTSTYISIRNCSCSLNFNAMYRRQSFKRQVNVEHLLSVSRESRQLNKQMTPPYSAIVQSPISFTADPIQYINNSRPTPHHEALFTNDECYLKPSEESFSRDEIMITVARHTRIVGVCLATVIMISSLLKDSSDGSCSILVQMIRRSQTQYITIFSTKQFTSELHRRIGTRIVGVCLATVIMISSLLKDSSDGSCSILVQMIRRSQTQYITIFSTKQFTSELHRRIGTRIVGVCLATVIMISSLLKDSSDGSCSILVQMIRRSQTQYITIFSTKQFTSELHRRIGTRIVGVCLATVIMISSLLKDSSDGSCSILVQMIRRSQTQYITIFSTKQFTSELHRRIGTRIVGVCLATVIMISSLLKTLQTARVAYWFRWSEDHKHST